jgi:adenosylcobinamide-GDP ribazoletransferase
MPDSFRREGRHFLAAAALLTRCPLPRFDIEPDWLPRSARYFPLIGAVIGAVAAAVFLAADGLWPRPIPAILVMAATAALTGALHEDGLADSFDALGGYDRATRLLILKDSRLGTFGVLALLGSLALQISALSALPPLFAALALLGGHAAARLVPVLFLAVADYAGDPASAKVAAAPSRPRAFEVAVAALLALLTMVPLAVEHLAGALAGIVLGAVLAALAAWRLTHLFGGHTGDALGATNVIFFTGFLLGAAAAS